MSFDFSKINLCTKIISDLHFGHDNILRFEPKRLEKMKELGIEDHDEFLKFIWNSQISKDDTVLILGDFSFKSPANYLDGLNGNKILILGNHDRKGLQTYPGVEVIRGVHIDYNKKDLVYTNSDELLSGLLIDIAGNYLTFCHYPLYQNCEFDMSKEQIKNRIEILEEFYESFCSDYVIHGHLHSNDTKFKYGINCSLEATDFKIRTIRDIIEITKEIDEQRYT